MSEDKVKTLETLEIVRDELIEQRDALNDQIDSIETRIRRTRSELIIPQEDLEKILKFYNIVLQYCEPLSTRKYTGFNRSPIYYEIILNVDVKSLRGYSGIQIMEPHKDPNIPIPDNDLRELLFKYGIEYEYTIYEPLFDESGFKENEQIVVFSTADKTDETHEYDREDFKLISL